MVCEFIDKSLLQIFVLVNVLLGDQLDWLLDQQEVCCYEVGDVLFCQGDWDNIIIYLLSGEVELFSEYGECMVISVGDSVFWYLLGYFQLCWDDCKVVGEVSVVCFDSFWLDIILFWDQFVGYVIFDINVNVVYQYDWEWMIWLFKFKLFYWVLLVNILEIFCCLCVCCCKEGEVIVIQGEQVDCCYIIKEGVCEVVIILGGKSSEVMLVVMFEEGQWFGEEVLFFGKFCNVIVIMVIDGVLMCLDWQDFDVLLCELVIYILNLVDVCQCIDEGVCWLDVCIVDEFDQQYLVGVINILLGVLCLKFWLFDFVGCYVVYCDIGWCSVIVVFLLKNVGLDVFVLDGGFNNNVDILQDYLKQYVVGVY